MDGALNERVKLYNSGSNAIDETVSLICSHTPSGDERTKLLNELKASFLEYNKHQFNWTKSMNCLNIVKQNIEENPDEFCTDVLEMYNSVLASSNRKGAFNKTKIANEFEAKVTNYLENQAELDEDVIQTEATVCLIDPITKKLMTNPVTNIYCNHTYDLDTISAMIDANKKKAVFCPYQGCPNTQALSKADLRTDNVALLQLHRMAQEH